MNTSNITNYKPKDFAELLGVSVKTLQRWDREGILKSNRTPTNRRYYTYDQYLAYKGTDIKSKIISILENDLSDIDKLNAIKGVIYEEEISNRNTANTTTTE